MQQFRILLLQMFFQDFLVSRISLESFLPSLERFRHLKKKNTWTIHLLFMRALCVRILVAAKTRPYLGIFETGSLIVVVN